MSDISRRSIIKTAAWSVPAVTLAAAAPAFATSADPVPPTSCLVGFYVTEKKGKFKYYISSNQFPVNNVTAVTVRFGKRSYEFRLKDGVWTHETTKKLHESGALKLVYHYGRRGKVDICVNFVSGDPTPSPKPGKNCKKHGKKNCKKC